MAFAITNAFSGAQPPRFTGDAGGLPANTRTRPDRRRMVALREARQALDHLPAGGETLHGLMPGTYDLMHLILVLLGALGSAEQLRIATLSLSAKNVSEMAGLLDDGTVRRLDLLCSDFFRRHDREIFAGLVQEFQKRGQRVAAARSHCKVVTLALTDGRRYVLEGSANLRSNHNLEQFALSRDARLHAFYDAWLAGMVTRHEIHESDRSATGC
jgi:hypothetical protein